MKRMTVACFGHTKIMDGKRFISNTMRSINALMEKYQEIEFLVGCEGRFNTFVQTVILESQKYDTQILTIVMPYEITHEADSTNIEIGEAGTDAHHYVSPAVRIHEMIDRADLVLCYVDHEGGAAWTALQYAISQSKDIVNLYEKAYT